MAQKRQLPSKAFEINAPWTVHEPVKGWHHYRITALKPASRSETGETMVEMMAVCDRSVRFWIGRRELIADLNWVTGWLNLPESEEPY
jgi:tryptophan-rich hypothetical protein